ncbi:hypothetical protein XELAEV_18035318mg [Xenopus laevis]|uniref:GIY-YIG domain-containing protein n=1 Tax=Xenopus laevis TaxID=8355 RepID=A0A974CFQ3_XENLA|nr:hypothetical protein XELAEV_18035318mg [Xenopus laevis]
MSIYPIVPWTYHGRSPSTIGPYLYRRANNLRDKVSPSMLPNKKDKTNWLNVTGTYKCGANICKCCGFINVSKEIQSTVTKKIYNCRTYANCRTSDVIYLATCRCGKQYVGKTKRWLKDRVLEHLACINRFDVSSAVAEHVIQEHEANEYFVSFQVIEAVKLGKRKGHIDTLLSKKEVKWMTLLDTVTPYGLNRECEIKNFIG